ncbi:MAG: hypothetical protein BWY78_00930 [Alphaproteobacteria bacterium ADurb.Bin438]|nr:MAG: hypothetical protein BWY78_00930 [Alphaproteobacteria bacterium ADurb.Bin438]
MLKKIGLFVCLAALSSCSVKGLIFNSQDNNPQVNESIEKNAKDIAMEGGVRTVKSAEYFNLEYSARCRVDNNKKEILHTIPFDREVFKLERAGRNDALPKYMVNDFNFEKKQIDQVVRELFAETDITVHAKDGPYPTITGEGVSGELSEVLSSVVASGDVYYTYNAKRKYLEISRYSDFVLRMPKDRYLVISALDALRGAGMSNLTADWEEGAIYFNGDKQVEEKTLKLIELYEKEPSLILYDVVVFRVSPKNNGDAINWQEMVDGFGSSRIKAAKTGLMGKLLVVDSDVDKKSLLKFMNDRAIAGVVSEGVYIVPDQWKGKFEVGRCGRPDSAEVRLSLVSEASFLNNKFENKMIVDSVNGELSSYKIGSRVNENLLIIGIPAKAFSPNVEVGETAILLRPRTIRLIKKEK